MNDSSRFELRIATLLSAYADRLPIDVDALTVARQAAANSPSGLRWRGLTPSTHGLRLALAGALLVALAGALVAGGRLLAPPRDDILRDGYRGIFETVRPPTKPFTKGALLRDGRVIVFEPGFAPEYFDPSTAMFAPTDSASSTTPPIPGNGPHPVVLSDGRVLVLAGEEGRGVWYELFDPATGSWTPVPSIERDYGSTALLTNGRVLVVSSAMPQVYDPASGLTRRVGPMAALRSADQLVPLADGRVLVLGGSSAYPDVGFASAEVFDPVTDSFSPVGPMSQRRATDGYTATRLADGRVLIAGGVAEPWAVIGAGRITKTPEPILASAEIFDPGSGTFSAAGAMTRRRVGHGAALLADGRILIVNGTTAWRDGDVSSADIFDPAIGWFTEDMSMREAHPNPRLFVLADGRVLVLGARGDGAEIYR